MTKQAIEVRGPMHPGFEQVLSEEALRFIASLASRFGPSVAERLEARQARQRAIDDGQFPDFLAETQDVRSEDWAVSSIPADLSDRRVEITGPTDRKMIINALNSGANVFMADCEDSLSPTWENVIQGQINLRDAVDRSITLESKGKQYALNDETATLIVRPRGWHLVESHLLVDGKPVPAGLVDFGLYLIHNAGALSDRGTGPYFYLPKLESHLEARLWADVFKFAESEGIVAADQIRVTVLIETLPAAFEMEEILYELKDYIVGLNVGRWDYIFSFIKCFHRHPAFVLPDRAEVTMTTHFLRSYSQLVVQTCHRRKAYAIGGMAAQIPIKNDPEANEIALERVRADKLREVTDGHDGTWVAHPGLVSVARDIFDAHMPGNNQLDNLREDLSVTADDLLQVPKGKITETGVRQNIRVALLYIAAWLDGNGCVPIDHLMEDAATAEISRAQLWQWAHHATGILDEGRNADLELFRDLLRQETEGIREEVGDDAFEAGQYRAAAKILDDVTGSDEFLSFITLAAYPAIQANPGLGL